MFIICTYRCILCFIVQIHAIQIVKLCALLCMVYLSSLIFRYKWEEKIQTYDDICVHDQCGDCRLYFRRFGVVGLLIFVSCNEVDMTSRRKSE